MSSGTMTRRKRSKRVPVVEAEAKPRVTSFVARPCSACEGLRPNGTNYSRVYCVTRQDAKVVRYVKCSYCGNTWKQITAG